MTPLDHNIQIKILNRHFNIFDLALFFFAPTFLNVLSLLKREVFLLLSHHLTQTYQLSSLYINYPFVALLKKNDLLSYQFADDITLFTEVSFPDPNPTLHKLSSCLSALNSWFFHSQLKLSPDKSEMMFFGISS